ncbi:MAG: hypothetical protein DRO39_04620 [Thermoprotei archaeon]|nr:MAG: hypothetical protein DRO39_04620 [Thermoprotei archaeon]
MSVDFLEALDDMIEVGVEVSTWEDAVRAAGSLLVRGGVAREEYVEAMIRTVKELGPYAVIAPGVAIPHARPEDGALRVGFSIVVLRRGVNFGSPNDPVYIVIGFAAVDKKSHLNALQQLADMLSNREFIEALKRARSPGDVKEAVKRFSKRG